MDDEVVEGGRARWWRRESNADNRSGSARASAFRAWARRRTGSKDGSSRQKFGGGLAAGYAKTCQTLTRERSFQVPPASANTKTPTLLVRRRYESSASRVKSAPIPFLRRPTRDVERPRRAVSQFGTRGTSYTTELVLQQPERRCRTGLVSLRNTCLPVRGYLPSSTALLDVLRRVLLLATLASF